MSSSLPFFFLLLTSALPQPFTYLQNKHKHSIKEERSSSTEKRPSLRTTTVRLSCRFRMSMYVFESNLFPSNSHTESTGAHAKVGKVVELATATAAAVVSV